MPIILIKIQKTNISRIYRYCNNGLITRRIPDELGWDKQILRITVKPATHNFPNLPASAIGPDCVKTQTAAHRNEVRFSLDFTDMISEGISCTSSLFLH